MAELDHEATLTTRLTRPIRTTIVGGGRGCESILRMVEEDTLGRFQMEICGVADTQAAAAGWSTRARSGSPSSPPTTVGSTTSPTWISSSS